jgi:uncharacterized protein YlzI (FlbEa/FlbD family)
MKVYIEKDTICWINGKEYTVKAGIQEVEDNVAEVLIQAGYAKPVKKAVEEEEKRPKK